MSRILCYIFDMFLRPDLEWLFEAAPADWQPQMGSARSDKRALWWFPGRTEGPMNPGAFWGCSQVAFPPGVRLAAGPCLVAWLGVDVDLPEPLGIAALESLKALRCSIRRSAGGAGLHLIWRLSQSVSCDWSVSGAVVKALVAPWAARVARVLPVCSADRRMFWLWGGQQVWLHQTDDTVEPERIAVPPARPVSAVFEASSLEDCSPGIEAWLARLIEAGALRGSVGWKNRIHVGSARRVLEAWGETVLGKSGRRTAREWHVNGHLDVRPNRLRLWSYGDGRIVWAFSDIDSWLMHF